jgi:hypothetical protein
VVSCSECETVKKALAKAESDLDGLVVIFGVFFAVLTADQVTEVRRQLSARDLALPT